MKSSLPWQFILFLSSPTYPLHLTPDNIRSSWCGPTALLWHLEGFRHLWAFFQRAYFWDPVSLSCLSSPSGWCHGQSRDWWRMEGGEALPIRGVTTLFGQWLVWFMIPWRQDEEGERVLLSFYFRTNICAGALDPVHTNPPQELSTISVLSLFSSFSFAFKHEEAHLYFKKKTKAYQCLQTNVLSLVLFFLCDPLPNFYV